MASLCRNCVFAVHSKILLQGSVTVRQQSNRTKLTRAAFTTSVCNNFRNCTRPCTTSWNNNGVTCNRPRLKINVLASGAHHYGVHRCIHTNHLRCEQHSLFDSEQKQKPKNEEDMKVFTHFGYEEVEESEKVDKVYSVFENVAQSYDVMNDMMSAGAHRLWKTKFVTQLNVRPTTSVLDMAGGTGDIAFKIFDDFTLKYPKHSIADDKYPKIIISDINQSMLDVGKERAKKLGIDKLFRWVQADAEELPFEDESFDLYTIAFGIRNTTHIEKVLDEAFRVLKIGGRLSCLEFSHVENAVVSEMYDAYSFQVIPVMGQVFANDWNSYQYLVESIRKFPKQDEFAHLIYEAGFSNVRYEDLTFGVVAIHDAFKI